MTNKGKTYLTEKDLQEHPIWARSEEDDLIYPVFCPEDFPDDSRSLKIRADFTTANGMTLKGYICGIENIFGAALFWDNEILYMNKNWLDACLEGIHRINQDLETKMKPEDFSPLHYQTTIDLEHFNNFMGEFDLFKERTDEERLSDISDEEE
jgi:hypothetical protein